MPIKTKIEPISGDGEVDDYLDRHHGFDKRPKKGKKNKKHKENKTSYYPPNYDDYNDHSKPYIHPTYAVASTMAAPTKPGNKYREVFNYIHSEVIHVVNFGSVIFSIFLTCFAEFIQKDYVYS